MPEMNQEMIGLVVTLQPVVTEGLSAASIRSL